MYEGDGRWAAARAGGHHECHERRPLSGLLEDCAKAIFAAQQHDGGCASCVALAERLGLSPTSTAETVAELAELGLARWEPPSPLALTRAGQKVALEVIRHRAALQAEFAHALTGSPVDVDWTGPQLTRLSIADVSGRHDQ